MFVDGKFIGVIVGFDGVVVGTGSAAVAGVDEAGWTMSTLAIATVVVAAGTS